MLEMKSLQNVFVTLLESIVILQQLQKPTHSFSLTLNLVLIYRMEAKQTLRQTVASKSTAVRSFFKASNFTIVVSSAYRKPFYTLAFSSPNSICQFLYCMLFTFHQS